MNENNSIFTNLKSKTVYIPQKAYEYLRTLINDKNLKIGDKLPSEQELTKLLNISRSSLRIALSRLEFEGYIQKTHGVGTFVIGNSDTLSPVKIEYSFSITDNIKSQGKIPGTSEFDLIVIEADKEIAKKLDVKLHSSVMQIKRLRTGDGKPFSYDINLIPSKYLPEKFSKDEVGESLFTYIEKYINPKIAYFSTSYKPLISDDFISEKLSLPKGSLILKNTQIHYSDENKPIWYLELWIPELERLLQYIKPHKNLDE